MKKGRGKDGESRWKSGVGTSTALYLVEGWADRWGARRRTEHGGGEGSHEATRSRA